MFYGEAGGSLSIYSPQGFRPTRRQKPYPVERGDTLPRLSKKFYGKRGYWDVIYRTNIDVIPKSFALRRGMYLIIP
jgi:nucleoid-associated protein YgaU